MKELMDLFIARIKRTFAIFGFTGIPQSIELIRRKTIENECKMRNEICFGFEKKNYSRELIELEKLQFSQT